MKFNTIKEMEVGLLKITDESTLKEDIVFKSQGEEIVVKYVSEGVSAGNKEMYYIGDDNSSNVRVSFTGSGRSINVIFVKVNKV